MNRTRRAERFDLAALGDLAGVRLIEANAGTGKTYTIESLFLLLLLERALPVDRILVVSFTEAATAELRARLRARLRACRAALREAAPPAGDPTLELLHRRFAGDPGATARLDLALLSFDTAAIHTIHGFCRRALDAFAFECGGRLATTLLPDAAGLLEEAVCDFCRTRVARGDDATARLAVANQFHPEKLLGNYRATLGKPEFELLPRPGESPSGGDAHPLAALLADLHRTALARTAAEKRRTGLRTYDDLLLDLRDALEGPRGEPLAAALSARYGAALIDEFQDTDPVQYAIFRRAFRDRGTPLFLIGDPKQAIYGFRGADIFTYLRAAADAPRRLTLTRNHRSDPRLIDAVNRLFAAAEAPFLLPEIGYTPSLPPETGEVPPLEIDGAADAPLRALLLPADAAGNAPAMERAALSAAVGEIARLVRLGRDGRATIVPRAGEARRPLAERDIVALARTHDQAEKIRDALRAHGIQAVTYGDRSVFATDEAKELLLLLHALLRPRPGEARAALATPLFGLTAPEIAELSETPGALEERLVAFRAAGMRWRARGLSLAVRSLLRETGVLPRLLALPDGERRGTNLLHLLECLHAFERGGDPSPEALLDRFARAVAAGRDADGEEGEAGQTDQLRLESDAQAVRVLTMHKSKGLEFPVVVCPFVCKGARGKAFRDKPVLFHDPDLDRRVADLGTAERFTRHLPRQWAETLAEELRIFYVAATRASHRFCFVYGPFPGAATAAPTHLLLDLPGLSFADPDFKAAETAFKAMSADEIVRRVRERLGPAGPCAVVTDPADAGTPLPPRDTSDAVAPAARPFARRLADAHRLVSYSSLVAPAKSAGGEPPPAEEPPERPDAVEVDEPAAPEAAEGPGIAAPAAGREQARRFGHALHRALERCDLADDPVRTAEAALRAVGADAARRDELAGLIERVGSLTLAGPEGPFPFRAVDLSAAAREMEFHLPVRDLSCARLARVFRAHGRADLAARLDGLAGAPASGHLKGFVDLVFCHGRRYHLLDWKTDRLGGDPAAFAPAPLARTMVRHLYDLQAHLYAAALHAHLAVHLPGYDPGRHFGGIHYVFVRGLPAPGEATADAPSRGVHHARPEAALLDALLVAMRTPAGAAHGGFGKAGAP